MKNKLLYGIAALGLAATVATAESYYLFEFKGITAPNSQANAWGSYIMGFAYNGATSSNPSEANNGITVYNQGVAKLSNIGWNVPANQYPGAYIALKHTSGDKKPSDCTDGFSYWYKSNTAHTFIAEFPISECTVASATYGNQWKVKTAINASTTWIKNTIVFNSTNFDASDATGCGTIAHDLSKISQISWGYSGGAFASADLKSSMNLMIANVACLNSSADMGDNAAADFPDNYAYSSNSNSSSSGNNSSSSGNNNSSSSGGNNNSSDSGGSSSSIGGGTIYYCKLSTGDYCELMIDGKAITTLQACLALGGAAVTDCSASPILNISSIAGLTITQHARSLQISSAQESKIQLFDMRGERVLNANVPAGQATFSLENQKLGIYYAVISSGSHKQTVKVVVK